VSAKIVDILLDAGDYNMQVGAAVAFGTLLFFNLGSSKASEFFAGYVFSTCLLVLYCFDKEC